MRRVNGKVVLVGGGFLVGILLSLWLGGLSPGTGLATLQPEQRSDQRRYRYRRIICMSPAVAEIVFGVGAGSRVVGVSQHTKWPPEAMDKPKCGGFVNPNYELIFSLEPDLLITQGLAEHMKEFAGTNCIDLVSLELTDLESIFTQTERVGEVLELEARAELICAEMRHRLAQVRVRVSDKPPVRVLLVAGREPGELSNIFAVGSGTFLHDLVQIAGGRNVASDLASGYGVVNKETLLARGPEVVVELHGEGGDQAHTEKEVRELWQGLAPLPAVQQGRIYVIEATYAMIPGPRVVQLADRLADLFHGDEAPLPRRAHLRFRIAD